MGLSRQEEKFRQVQFPNSLLKQFCEFAWQRTPNEFMGWITGTVEHVKKAQKTILYGNGLFIPKQEGESFQVMEPVGSSDVPKEMLQHLESTRSVVIGWIHSHPTFDSFFSSVDQHMQHLLQRDQPLAFGVVVDKNKKPRVLRLSPKGMQAVEGCSQNAEDMCFSSRKSHARF